MAQYSEILNVTEVADLLAGSMAHVSKAIQDRAPGVTPLPAISLADEN